MSLDESLAEQRREKLEAIRQLGFAVYPHRFAFTHTAAQIAAQFGGQNAEALDASRPRVKVAGRILALRGHGKAGFAHLQQDGARVQIYVRADALGEAGFALWKLLDLGDFIGADGYLFRTRTGELTVHVERLEFLAKDLLPLPEKWHGLQDIEARYRQRYLDLTVNPPAREVFVRRARMMEALRDAFTARGYVEVETPMMQPLAGGAVAKPFVTHHHALDLQLYLRIAPELYLKRLVIGGLDRVYEINRNFRNEGISTRHNPEFTMLEFYEAYSDYTVLMDWSRELLAHTAQAVTGGATVSYQDRELDFSQLWRLTLREAVREYWPQAAAPAPTPAELGDPRSERVAAERYNRMASTADGSRYRPVALEPDAAPGVTAAALFEAVAEKDLVQPVAIYDFPLAVSPLAKAKDDEPDWVERFEIFAGGMELANGYSELNDPAEQRRRFEMQMRQRERGDAEAHAMDEDYLRAMQYGLPPTAGEGIGMDRLCMLLTNSASIRDVILFPLLRPE
ncbi:MAG: lysine--tRNA ligase [Terriglobales bacterium]